MQGLIPRPPPLPLYMLELSDEILEAVKAWLGMRLQRDLRCKESEKPDREANGCKEAVPLQLTVNQ